MPKNPRVIVAANYAAQISPVRRKNVCSVAAPLSHGTRLASRGNPVHAGDKDSRKAPTKRVFWEEETPRSRRCLSAKAGSEQVKQVATTSLVRFCTSRNEHPHASLAGKQSFCPSLRDTPIRLVATCCACSLPADAERHRLLRGGSSFPKSALRWRFSGAL